MVHYVNTFREKFIPGSFRFDIGGYGVDIFFVISGYIMYAICKARSPTPAAFMKNRILRIVPLYWVLTIFAAFVSTSNGVSVSFDIDFAALIKSLLFIPEWHHKYTEQVAPVLLVGWTLNLEMAFYLVFAVSLAFPRRIGIALVLLTLVAMGTAREWSEPLHALVYAPEPNAAAVLYTKPIILEFAAGILIGMIFTNAVVAQWMAAHLKAMLVLACGLTVVSILWLVDRPDMASGNRFLRLGVPATMLVTAALLAEPFLARFRFRLLELLGDASYSIYLTHLMAMPVVYALIGTKAALTAPLLALGAQIACAVAIGVLVYILVEHPLTQMTKGRPPFRRFSQA